MSLACRPCHPEWYPGQAGGCGCLRYCGSLGCDAYGVGVGRGPVEPFTPDDAATAPGSGVVPEGLELGPAKSLGPVPKWRVDAAGFAHLCHGRRTGAVCGRGTVGPLRVERPQVCRACYVGAVVRPPLPWDGASRGTV